MVHVIKNDWFVPLTICQTINIRFRGFFFRFIHIFKCVSFIILVSYVDTYSLNNQHNRILLGYMATCKSLCADNNNE